MSTYINDYVPLRDRIGQIGFNKLGEKMEVIDCFPNSRVEVRFMDGKGCTVNTKYSTFLEGAVKNYNRICYGFRGYLGQGPYETIYKKDGKKINKPEFNVWNSMHKRAGNYSGEKPTYSDVTVCDEWCNYQNFAKWYNENVYEAPGEKLCLDKDILYPGNKIYSPKTCRLVPDGINQLFKQPPRKNNDLPIGVVKDSSYKTPKYRTIKLIELDFYGNKHKFSKTCDTMEEAFMLYKYYHEKYVHDTAEIYKTYIPIEIYNALKQYRFDLYN